MQKTRKPSVTGLAGASDERWAFVDEIADDLIQKCLTAIREGADFQTVWQTLLRRHSLIAGPPIQSIESGRVCLKIPLISNQWLVYDSTSKEFALLRRQSLDRGVLNTLT